jgi:hypothetical protein
LSPKKHKLAVSIDEDYCLLGIVSDEPDYKLCWLINEQLKFSFSKTDNLTLFNRKTNTEQIFSIFLYLDESTMINYRLIANRNESDIYLAELKNIDYVLHIQGELKSDDILDMITELLSVESIRMCAPIDLKKIKQQDRLQLW